MSAELKPSPFGLFEMPAHDYFNKVRGVNFSTLKHFRLSALHGRQSMLSKSEPSKEMRFGSLAHAYILEHESFLDGRIVEPRSLYYDDSGKKRDGRFKDVKDDRAAFAKSACGLEIVTYDEAERLSAMRRAFVAHPLTRHLLDGKSLIEQTAMWQHDVVGQAKARLDLVRDGIIYDYKTTSDPLDKWVDWCFWKRGYHAQGAWYLDGYNAVAFETVTEVKFIVQESSAPYDIAIYNATDALIAGRNYIQECITNYLKEPEQGTYEGFAWGHEIHIEVRKSNVI
jgi:hypothetical protein